MSQEKKPEYSTVEPPAALDVDADGTCGLCERKRDADDGDCGHTGCPYSVKSGRSTDQSGRVLDAPVASGSLPNTLADSAERIAQMPEGRSLRATAAIYSGQPPGDSPWIALAERTPEWTEAGGDVPVVLWLGPDVLADDCPAHRHVVSNPKYAALTAAKAGYTHWMPLPEGPTSTKGGSHG